MIKPNPVIPRALDWTSSLTGLTAFASANFFAAKASAAAFAFFAAIYSGVKFAGGAQHVLNWSVLHFSPAVNSQLSPHLAFSAKPQHLGSLTHFPVSSITSHLLGSPHCLVQHILNPIKGSIYG